ncbi:DUF5941 domain-containing protein [Streptomyces sp. WMMC500]|uniref:DUF5941 domain-containing protein n=1 Tax=Streptomyces sp. WMMC500 TaxID=3015154 RepID=UPI00248B5E4C|nr:DUF5941 domain-containing protein [Streptomyces sp. WMMC500]WBB64359.1 DUF5941 domain-containing protein [Streptomyces sp. WMMC500]
MRTAILIGPPVPGSPLESDLRSLGYDDVRTAADVADAATVLALLPGDGGVALVDSRFVGHRHSLRLTLADPRFPGAAVPGVVAVRTPAARTALSRAVMRSRTLDGVAEQTSAQLADADGPLARPELGVLVAAVPEDALARAKATDAVAAVDEEKARLRAAVKSRDGFFTTFFISPYSRYLARWCANRGLTPNQVTTASLATAVLAAGCAATGTRAGFVAAGALLLLSFVLDCTDGQLARYSLQYSTLGAWLDATFDRAKEYAYFAGLALGAANADGDDVWALALAAMVLQTCRHVVDFAFNESLAGTTAAAADTSPTAALSERLDRLGWTVWLRRMIVLPIGERWALIAVLTAVTTPRVVFVVLLVGMGLAASYTTAGRVLRSLRRRVPRSEQALKALDELTDTGPLAEAAARSLRAPARSLPWGVTGMAPALAAAGGALLVALALFTPYGTWWPLIGAVGYVLTSALAVSRPLAGPLDWLVPPVFRAAEYGLVLVLAARSEVNGALPAAFGLVAAVAYHHYDTVYRIRGGTGAPPRRLVRAIGGHEGRALAVTLAAALLTGTGFTFALAAIAVAVALVVLTESIRFWVSSGAPAVHDETGEPA